MIIDNSGSNCKGSLTATSKLVSSVPLGGGPTFLIGGVLSSMKVIFADEGYVFENNMRIGERDS